MMFMKAQAWEAWPERHHPDEHPTGYSRRRVGTGLVRPVGKIEEPSLPLIYSWSETYEELQRQRSQGDLWDPYDGYLLQYVNPVSGGPTLPTLDCRMQLLPSGSSTRSHRHMANYIYRVFRGRGWSEIGGHHLEWEAGDCFIVPQWIWHSHGATSEDAILFSMNDQPIFEPFGLYYAETAS
jgi:gentisate 1,2-dioxygenase